jgi:hypothetical protein
MDRRVFNIVEPTGSFESDPTDWVRLTPEELKRWREKLAKIETSKGKIIN